MILRIYVGGDVSKKHIDVCIRWDGKDQATRRFANSLPGYRELLDWVQKKAPLESELRFCLESTGVYSLGLATFLAELDLYISIENPRTIRHFGIAHRKQNKTDKADAKIIALYAEQMSPPAWPLADKQSRALSFLLDRVRQLEAVQNAERNRLEMSEMLEPLYVESVQRHLSFLQSEMEALHSELQKILAQNPDRQAMVHVLCREPAMGELTALRMLDHLGWDYSTYQSAQQAAAAAGLNPVKHESGEYRGKTRISRHGSSRFRSGLWMSAVVAIRHNPRLRAVYLKFLDRGMTKKAAVTACMRKLVMICYGLLKAHQRGTPLEYSGPKEKYTDLFHKSRKLPKHLT